MIKMMHRIETRTKLALIELADRIKQNRLILYEIIHPDMILEAKAPNDFLDQACFVGSVSILQFLFGMQHPVTIETLCDVTALEKIDVKERVDWLLQKNLVELTEMGYRIAPNFKQNSLPYKSQVEMYLGNNLYNR